MNKKADNFNLTGRALAQSNAHKIGINEELISSLVDTFYNEVHKNEVIGPIFDKAIGDDWDTHLKKMKNFWSSVVLYSGKYSGKPMPIHRQLENINAEHFKVWLDLFHETLVKVAPSEEVVRHFMSRAEQIARSLQAGIFEEK